MLFQMLQPIQHLSQINPFVVAQPLHCQAVVVRGQAQFGTQLIRVELVQREAHSLRLL